MSGGYGNAPAVKRCKSCGAALWWLKNATTGRVAPIEVTPAEEPRHGNIVVNLEAGTYRIVPAAAGLYLNHFGVCPAASAYRRARPKATKHVTETATETVTAAFTSAGKAHQP